MSAAWIARIAAVSALLAGATVVGEVRADSIRWDGELLSLETSGERPLRSVLRQISGATGLPIGLRGDLGTLPPLRLDAVPLERALRQLAGGRSVVLRWTDLDGNERRIASAAVIASGAPSGRYAPADAQAGLAVTEVAPGPGEPVERVRELRLRAGPQTLADLARVAATHPDPVARELAVRGLARVEGDEATEALAAALQDREPSVRLRAARILSLRGGARAQSLLVAARPVERDPRVARQLDRFLTRFPGGLG